MKITCKNGIIKFDDKPTNITECSKAILLYLQNNTPFIKAILEGDFTLSYVQGDAKYDNDLGVLTVTITQNVATIENKKENNSSE